MKSESVHNNHTLESRLLNGDHHAFREIFERHWKEVYHYARRRIDSDEDSKELVQNLFLELWEKRDRFEIRNIESYLKVCVRNKCIDYIRSKAHQKQYFEHFKMFGERISNSTQESMEYLELSAQIDEALRTLPEKSRMIFRMSKMEGYSVNEISDKVNLSNKAVEYHLTKAMKAVKFSLKDFAVLRNLLSLTFWTSLW